MTQSPCPSPGSTWLRPWASRTTPAAAPRITSCTPRAPRTWRPTSASCWSPSRPWTWCGSPAPCPRVRSDCKDTGQLSPPSPPRSTTNASSPPSTYAPVKQFLRVDKDKVPLHKALVGWMGMGRRRLTSHVSPRRSRSSTPPSSSTCTTAGPDTTGATRPPACWCCSSPCTSAMRSVWVLVPVPGTGSWYWFLVPVPGTGS